MVAKSCKFCFISNVLDSTEDKAVSDEGAVPHADDDSEIENEFETDSATEAEWADSIKWFFSEPTWFFTEPPNLQKSLANIVCLLFCVIIKGILGYEMPPEFSADFHGECRLKVKKWCTL